MPQANPEYDAEPTITDRLSNINDRFPEAVDDTKAKAEETKAKFKQTKSKLMEFGVTATNKLNRNRDAAAKRLEGVSGALRQRADHVSIDHKVSDVARNTAEKLNATADYIRQNDFDSMVHDVDGLLRANSGMLMLMALGLGFVLGRRLNGVMRT